MIENTRSGRAAHIEAVTSIVRAGADIVLTCAALELSEWLAEQVQGQQ